MNYRHETVKMGVLPGNPAEPRESRTRGVLGSTPQGAPVLPVPSEVAGSRVEGRVEEARKDAHIHGRSHARA
jgi:hypothetical protein